MFASNKRDLESIIEGGGGGPKGWQKPGGKKGPFRGAVSLGLGGAEAGAGFVAPWVF